MRAFSRTLLQARTSYIAPRPRVSGAAAKSILATASKMPDLYKLKLEKGFSLGNGQKVEVEVEGADGVKVLVLKVNNQISVLGARCTHYGAPLVKGVVADDGRITCPWHGACFNTQSGDIENAPALDALNIYPVTYRDDSVYITAEKELLEAGSRKPDVRCTPQENGPGVVIVGGGSGGIGAIEGLREQGYKGKITVISREAYLPIDRTKLSKALLTDLSKLEWRNEAFFQGTGVKFELETEVDSVDFVGHKVNTKDGRDFEYSKAIFATGGVPRTLPMEGFKRLGNIFVLRGIEDARRILAASEGGKRVAVIGSSFIGMEIGKCLSGKGNEVTVIGMESAPLERVMGAKVGKIFQRQLEESGVKFRLGIGVSDAKPSPTDSSKVGAVELEGGENVECDLVVLGVGVAPATEYLKKSGIGLQRDGSINVDDHWRIEGVEDAYAVGDIATYPYPYADGARVRIEHWNVAQNAGRQAALHIANKRKPVPFIPIFWSALGAQLRYCGNTRGKSEDVIIKGSPDANKWTAYYTEGEEVVAVASQGTDPVVMQCAELMRRKKMPSKKEIEEGVDVLDIYVPASMEAGA